MILVITNSEDVTADYLCARIQEQGLPCLRLNTDIRLESVSVEYENGRIALLAHGRSIVPDDVSTVWYRRPKALSLPAGDDPAELDYVLQEWGEALEGFFAHMPFSRWINHPTHNATASCKLEQLTRATRCGMHVPETIVTRDPQVARRYWEKWRRSMIVKPISAGYIERQDQARDSLIYTHRVEAGDLANIELVSRCPTLLQEQVDKAADIRVTVVDEAIHCVTMRAAAPDGSLLVDIRRDNMEGVAYEGIEIPDKVREGLLSLLRSYNLRFAAVDFAITGSGDWVFFEINPNGQWAWLDLSAGLDIAGSFLASFSRDLEGKK